MKKSYAWETSGNVGKSAQSVEALCVIRRILKRLVLVDVIYVIVACISSFCCVTLLMSCWRVFWDGFEEARVQFPGIMGGISDVGYGLFCVISGWGVPILSPRLIYYVVVYLGMIAVMAIVSLFSRAVIWAGVTKGRKKIKGTMFECCKKTCRWIEKEQSDMCGYRPVFGLAASYICILVVLSSYGWEALGEFGWRLIAALVTSLIIWALPIGYILFMIDLGSKVGIASYIGEYVFNGVYVNSYDNPLKGFEELWAEYASKRKVSFRKLAILKGKRQEQRWKKEHEQRAASDSYSSASSSTGTGGYGGWASTYEEYKESHDLHDDLDAVQDAMNDTYGSGWGSDI